MLFANSFTMLFIGTAGWTIPKQIKHDFPPEGTHLERYAGGLNGVEINSSFYREHKYETYRKWASSVPGQLSVSVKLSRYFTQERRLQETGDRLKDVLHEISALGEKWAVLLVQLPPSLKFESTVARKFFAGLRKVYEGTVVLEPRHISWVSKEAIDVLADYQINKVLADPERCQTHERGASAA